MGYLKPPVSNLDLQLLIQLRWSCLTLLHMPEITSLDDSQVSPYDLQIFSLQSGDCLITCFLDCFRIKISQLSIFRIHQHQHLHLDVNLFLKDSNRQIVEIQNVKSTWLVKSALSRHLLLWHWLDRWPWLRSKIYFWAKLGADCPD